MTGLPDDPRLNLLLSVADDELILGHRHAQWTGWAPHIEEDLAFSSIAQDEMAHARLLYELAGPISGRDPDSLALGRQAGEYRNAWLCERPNGDWAYTIARQYLYDTADAIRVKTLSESTWSGLAELMGVIALEERYHRDHAETWFRLLAEGPSLTARERFAEGLSSTVGEAIAVFEPLPGEDALVRDGTLPVSNEEMLTEWLGGVVEALEGVSLDYVLARHVGAMGEMVPTGSGEMSDSGDALTVPGIARRDGRWTHQGGFAGAGGRRGRHSDDFLPLWEEMTNMYRSFPGAKW
jgi:ring-1,2-phenylacetyl-CoA epoxidase subunit PaaC